MALPPRLRTPAPLRTRPRPSMLTHRSTEARGRTSSCVCEAARSGAVNVGKLGLFIELDAIAAVAIGGTPFAGGRPRIAGTVVGAIVVGLVPVIVNMNGMSYYSSMVFKALIVVIAMWAQRKK